MVHGDFFEVHELIKNYPLFKKPKYKYLGQSEFHLLNLLDFLGHHCSNANSTCNLIFVSYGTHYNCTRKTVDSVFNLKKVSYQPVISEREETSKRMKDNYNLPSCLMVRNGNLSPLEYAPQTSDSGDYYVGKYKYSITCFIINNDQKIIMPHLVDWPD